MYNFQGALSNIFSGKGIETICLDNGNFVFYNNISKNQI